MPIHTCAIFRSKSSVEKMVAPPARLISTTVWPALASTTFFHCSRPLSLVAVSKCWPELTATFLSSPARRVATLSLSTATTQARSVTRRRTEACPCEAPPAPPEPPSVRLPEPPPLPLGPVFGAVLTSGGGGSWPAAGKTGARKAKTIARAGNHRGQRRMNERDREDIVDRPPVPSRALPTHPDVDALLMAVAEPREPDLGAGVARLLLRLLGSRSSFLGLARRLLVWRDLGGG